MNNISGLSSCRISMQGFESLAAREALARTRSSLQLLFLFSGILTSSCSPRVQTGTIEGHVSGASGISLSTESTILAVPNVNVTIRNPATSSMQTIRADFIGNFRVQGLTPGRYEITFAAKPFKQQVHAITVRRGETVDASTRMLSGRDAEEIVEISGCPARPVAGLVPPDLSSVEIQLRRTGCYGPCPIYSVHLHGDGHIEYRGERYVGVSGIRNFRVEPSAILDLAKKFFERGFFNLCASYRERATDLPTVSTSFQIGTFSKMVSAYGDRTPEGLEELDERIEQVANLRQLVEPECTKTIRVQGSFPSGPFRTLPNESYRQSPTIKYVVQEDGTVSNATITRSSGLSDMDKKVLDAIARWKYKPRPAGCGAIESEMVAIIHLQ
jgi:TonB family protein